MAETVTMPKLGFDMAEGKLVRWVKHEGDPVAKGEVLAEIETDKATVEVESSYSGVVRKELVEEGTVVPVGDPIAVVAAPDEAADEAQGATPEAAPTQAPKAEAEPEIAPKGKVEPVNPPAAKKVHQMVEEEAARAEEGNGQVPGGTAASPIARRIARERGLDLSRIQGSGPGGRIVRRDVEQAQPQAAPQQAPAPAPQPAPPAAQAPQAKPVIPVLAVPAWTPGAPQLKEEKIPIERLRAIVGRRMTEAKQQVPHFYVTHDYAMDALMDLRKQLNAALPEDQKLTVNDFLVRAAALTLLQFPNLNASIEGDQFHRHGNVNIGTAVSVPGGLMTVVTHAADQKPLRVISSELREMITRARSGKVRPNDIEGSTFSISNMGMYGVDEFLAIINPPEAAILAVGSARQVPVVVDGEVKPGWRMRATLSADHRVTDGAEAAQFLQAMAEFIENPVRLLL